MLSYVEKFQVTVVREQHTDRIISIRYEDEQGRLHRTGGLPALEVFDPSTSRLVAQQFAESGAEHRIGSEPSYIEMDPDTGRTLIERWRENNMPRANDVDTLHRDPVTGEVVKAVSRKDGKQIIDNIDKGDALDFQP